MFIKAARALASLVREDELAEGRVYPALKRIHEVSLTVAVAVAEEIYARNLTSQSRPANLVELIQSHRFHLDYPNYCPAPPLRTAA